MSLSVVVCTYNRARLLRRMLDTLLAQDLRDVAEIVLVDNNSRDETPAVLKEFAAQSPVPVVLLAEKRQGKTFAGNTGMKAANGDVIISTDDDVLLPAGWLDEVRAQLARHPDVDVFGGRVRPLPPDGRGWPDWVHWEDPDNTAEGPLVDHNKGAVEKSYHEPGMCTPIGANFLVRRRVVERYGFYDEAPAGNDSRQVMEDSAFFNRLKRHGVSMLYCPSLRVEHITEPSRATKEYFRKYSARVGRSRALTATDVDPRRLLAGVPRDFYRKLARSAWRYLAAVLGGQKASLRFARELDVIFFWAIIRGFRARSRG